MRQRRNTGPLFLFFAALLWSFCGLFTKSVAWDGVSIGAVRGMVALPIITAVCRPFPIRLNRIKIFTAVCYFAQGFLIILANKYTTAANAAVLQYTSPLYIILFSSIAGRRLPRRRDVITCLVLLAGISLAFLGSLEDGGVLGNLLALASALFYAGVFYCSRRPGADAVDSMILGNALYLLFLPWVLTSEAVRTAPLRDLGLVALFGITAGAGAWLCFARGIRTTSSLHANFITMLEPVMAPLWTFLLLRETVSASSLAGCAVVVVTLVVYNTVEQK